MATFSTSIATSVLHTVLSYAHVNYVVSTTAITRICTRPFPLLALQVTNAAWEQVLTMHKLGSNTPVTHLTTSCGSNPSHWACLWDLV